MVRFHNNILKIFANYKVIKQRFKKFHKKINNVVKESVVIDVNLALMVIRRNTGSWKVIMMTLYKSQ